MLSAETLAVVNIRGASENIYENINHIGKYDY